MRTVLLVTEKPFASSAVAGIEAALPTDRYKLKTFEKYTSVSDLRDELRAVQPEAVIIRSDIADSDFFAAAGKNLKIVVRAGAGVDNIDLSAATEAGVVAMNTPGQNSNAVAELAFGMMLMHARGRFTGESSGFELRGKSLALYGCGNVSKYMCKIAQGFGMDIYAFDPYVTETQIKEFGAKPVSSVPDLFCCDFVSLHIPATPETKKSINESLLRLLPKNGVLINTARSEVIHEEDLKAFLVTRSDCGYLADVPPTNLADLLAVVPRQVFVTPKKMGAQTAEANNNAGPAAARQIVDFFEKGDVKFQVNKPGKTF
jgi:D-3-phosphoglycerate dehydrogenase / 2-oxoglutarate reductase